MSNVQTAKKEGNCICKAIKDNKIDDGDRIIGNLGISGKNIKYSLFYKWLTLV